MKLILFAASVIYIVIGIIINYETYLECKNTIDAKFKFDRLINLICFIVFTFLWPFRFYKSF